MQTKFPATVQKVSALPQTGLRGLKNYSRNESLFAVVKAAFSVATISQIQSHQTV